VVEVELLHEAAVGFSEGAGLADQGEGCCWGYGRLRGHEVGDYEGCGAGFSHGAVRGWSL